MKKLPYAMALLALAGCEGGDQITTAHHPPTRMILLAVDLSSTTGLDRVRRQRVKEVSLSADPGSDDLRLIKFGTSAEEIFAGSIDDVRKFNQKLDEISKPAPDIKTDYGAVADLTLKTVQASACREVVIIIIGDGCNDYRWDTKREHEYRVTCEKLAKDSRISTVRFWGVRGSSAGEKIAASGGPYAEIRDLYKPFGNRLEIRTANQSIL